jgi:hypothetical protein
MSIRNLRVLSPSQTQGHKSNSTTLCSTPEPESTAKDEKSTWVSRVLAWVHRGAQQALQIPAIKREQAKDLEAHFTLLGIKLR